MTAINADTFAHCNKLTSITIPNNVVYIGGHAFWDCSGLTSIVIPNGVVAIDQAAFRGCKSLSTITIPSSITYIGSLAFSDIDFMTVISKINNPFKIDGRKSYRGMEYWWVFSPNTFDNAFLFVPEGTIDKYRSTNGWKDFLNIREAAIGTDTPEYPIYTKVTNNGICYIITSNTECEVISGGDYSGDITIPESIYLNGKEFTVTTIGARAFSLCNNLSSVHIGSSVSSIGNQAFYECRNLTMVTIPNSVISIGDEAFRHCDNLLEITIPNSVTHIGEWAFCSTGLTSVIIPNSITTLPHSIFNGCHNLTSVVMPNSITKIEGKAFYRCKGLTSITLSNNTNSIGDWAFSECSGLTSITIPNSVTSIGKATFSQTPLTSVISHIGNPFEIEGRTSYENGNINREYYGAFDPNTFYNATLYVPKGSVEKYKSINGWKDFVFIEELPYETGMQFIDYENEKYDIHSLRGNKLTSPSKGINIIKMKDGTVKKVLIK